jgi:hypothetical protein
MATASSTPTQANPVPNHGDHDRVQMLSLKADGTPDQHNPEIIGDKEVAITAAKEQFAQQAVSAADVANAPAGGGTTVEDAPQDPKIEKVQKEHDTVATAAEKAAEKTVNELYDSKS